MLDAVGYPCEDSVADLRRKLDDAVRMLWMAVHSNGGTLTINLTSVNAFTPQSTLTSTLSPNGMSVTLRCEEAEHA